MSPRSWRHRVQDILEAVLKIGRYVEGLDWEGFLADPKTQDAVIRNLIVIGEAAGKVPEEVRGRHRDLPWRLMADLRNFAVHEYWGVRPRTIWQTVVADLPPLIPRRRALLAREQPNREQ